jgi:prophage maintenance system killer protein
MATIHYLTVQDILWINLQIVGHTQPWNYATLEEASFYQYSYGDSTNIPAQAARLATGFAKKAPFEKGNEATGLVAALTFLEMNGHTLPWNESELSQWFGRAQNAADASPIDEWVQHTETNAEALHGEPNVREIAIGIMGRIKFSGMASQSA